jgi:hypothetical protein
VEKVAIPPPLRDCQAQWESPASGLFHGAAFCTALLPTDSAIEPKKKEMGYHNIAYQGAQGKRATKLVARPPMGVIHDYVPFYFAPRSPMLFTIDKGCPASAGNGESIRPLR